MDINNIDVMQILLSALQFASVALLVWSVFRIRLKGEPPVNRRIALALGIAARQTVFDMPVTRQFMLAMLLASQRFPFFRKRVRQDLEACGNPNAYSAEEYLALCFASAVIGMILGLFLAGTFGTLGVVVLFASPFIGFYIPLWALHESGFTRTLRIAKKVPYSLDLIALMMEAGSTFTEAIDTVIRDEPHDDFHQELRLVQGEIEFGSTRAAALTSMANRIPLDSLRGVVGAINQSEALGTPLSVILKNQASMLRHLRSVRAEELAAKASLSILVPSMLILLAVVLVMFSPFILALWRNNGSIFP
ncbi:MAG: type II secretion system F family protein [Phycisphaerales bacterium]